MLLEKLAGMIASHILDGWPSIWGVSVNVSKPQVAFQGVLDGVSVSIWRQRSIEREGVSFRTNVPNSRL